MILRLKGHASIKTQAVAFVAHYHPTCYPQLSTETCIVSMGSIMTDRAVKCTAVISFGIIGLGGLFSTPAHAADDCLAGPKSTTPQGSHWYYHLEKGTGRKCWYLGSQGAKVNSSAPVARSSSPTQDESADASNAIENDQGQSLQPSVANARAELRATAPAPATASSPPSALPAPSLLSSQVSAPSASSSIPGSAQTLASRWPDPDSFKPAASPQVIAQNTASPPASDQAQQPRPAPSPAPAVSVQAQSTSSQSISAVLTPARIMLAAIFVILAITAIFARNAFRYFARPKVKITGRRDIWGQADYGGQSALPYEEMVTPERRIRNIGQPRQEADEIEYLLRRAANREARQRYSSS